MGEAWEKELAAFVRPRMVLVGVGSRLRGDDAFGPLLVDRLRGRTSWTTWDAGETPENDVGRICSYEPDRVLLLDAVRWGARPGQIGFFPSQAIPYQGASTHALSLRLFAELLFSRGRCPVALLGVEPLATGIASPLSEETTQGLTRVEAVLMRLNGLTG